MSEWRKWAAVAEERYDVVLFDLPGTVGNEGVLSTIVELDYLFIPMKADRIVLESTLNFASVLNARLIKTGASSGALSVLEPGGSPRADAAL